jgi:hypothetical protein
MNSLATGHQARTISRINMELPTHLQRVPATTQSGPSGMIDPLIQNHTWMTNRYTIHAPALLQGISCYFDASTLPGASTLPDPSLPMPREAGIGVFIVNTRVQPTQTIYIKAKLTETTLVIMAESAALALAATIADCMNLTNVNFLSDCEQLCSLPQC